MTRNLTSFLFVFLLVSAHPLSIDACILEAAGAAVGGALVIIGAPIALTAAGFTGAGIAAGSLAAKAMSLAYTTGVGAGVVSTLQAAGAAGVGYAAPLVGAVFGAGVGRYACSHANVDSKDENQPRNTYSNNKK